MLLSRSSPLFPYTTLFRSTSIRASVGLLDGPDPEDDMEAGAEVPHLVATLLVRDGEPVGHAAARIEVGDGDDDELARQRIALIPSHPPADPAPRLEPHLHPLPHSSPLEFDGRGERG